MKARINAFVRRPARWAVLPAIAIAGMLAGLSGAFAQGSNQAADYALSWEVAGGRHVGAYAQGGPIHPIHVPRHRHHR